MKIESEVLLEKYIREIMDPHSFAPSREFEGDANISKQAFDAQAMSLNRLFNNSITKSCVDLVNDYYKKFSEFFESGNRSELGIDEGLKHITEKFMVTIFPDLMDAIMLAHVQAYVTEWKKGFDGAGNLNIKKLVFSMSRNRKNQSIQFKAGYDYRIEAYKQKKSNSSSNLHTTWNNELESLIVEKALEDYDKDSSVAGGLEDFFKEIATKDLNPLEHFKSLSFYAEQFGKTKTVFLFMIQATILIASYKFLISQKLITSMGASFLNLIVVGKKATFIKLLTKILRKKVLSFFSKDSVKKQLVELELFDESLDPNIDLSKLYLEKYRKANPGVVTRGGKLVKGNKSSKIQNNNTGSSELDFLSDIEFDSVSGLKASQNEIKALRELISLILS